MTPATPPTKPFPVGLVVVLLLGAGVVAWFASYVFMYRKQVLEERLVVTSRLGAYAVIEDVDRYRAAHIGEPCPTLQQLRTGGAFDAGTSLVDAWGAPYELECRPDDTVVVSSGPDTVRGTADDLRVPNR